MEFIQEAVNAHRKKCNNTSIITGQQGTPITTQSVPEYKPIKFMLKEQESTVH